jgi:sulfite reductase (NADPH) flavoprotein alpha-component
MTWRDALLQRVLHLGLRARLAWAGRRAARMSRRDRAFTEYFLYLARAVGGDPLRARLRENRRLTRGDDARATHWLRLDAPSGGGFEPGDLVWVRWRNRVETIAEVRALLGPPPNERLRLWSHGDALAPARRVEHDAEACLVEVIDLERASPRLVAWARRRGLVSEVEGAGANAGRRVAEVLRACPVELRWGLLLRLQARIAPRVYTLARVPGAVSAAGEATRAGAAEVQGELELLVSRVEGRREGGGAGLSGRASGWLTAVRPGAELEFWRLPHPHRLPVAHGHGERGLVVVTGSAIAAVLAFLRAGRAPRELWLVWGLRDRVERGYFLDELEAYRASGVLARLDLVESAPGGVRSGGRRAPAWLAERGSEVAEWMKGGAWLYVSGQKALVREVRETLRDVLVEGGLASDRAGAEEVLHAWSDELRLVESSSG